MCVTQQVVSVIVCLLMSQECIGITKKGCTVEKRDHFCCYTRNSGNTKCGAHHTVLWDHRVWSSVSLDQEMELMDPLCWILIKLSSVCDCVRRGC